jgi:phosphoadenosine phosphosulfate reductase
VQQELFANHIFAIFVAYKPDIALNFTSIKQKVFRYKDLGKKIFTSSSFQTHSIVLLHMLSRIDRNIPVYFINTGFHFPETLEFRDQISDLLSLNLIDLKSDTPKYLQKNPDGKLLFTSDPDYCCYLNKVQPMENVLRSYDVWINGVRADQSAARNAMRIEQQAPHNVIRFHPLLDWSAKMIYDYRKEFNLPQHPLDHQGYISVGCEPCTRKFDPELHERETRWYGLKKVECGLHTELAK